jgi:hypothetical protein
MQTLISWSLRVQRELSPNTVLTVGYVGSHGYHELIGIGANEPFPVICPASPCPAVYRGSQPADKCYEFTDDRIPDWLTIGRSAGSCRQVLHPCGHAEGESRACEYMDVVFRRDEFVQRAAGGWDSPLQPRALVPGVCTVSKALDDGDSLNQTTAGNAPGLASNPFNLRADKGLATFNVANLAGPETRCTLCLSAAVGCMQRRHAIPCGHS